MSRVVLWADVPADVRRGATHVTLQEGGTWHRQWSRTAHVHSVKCEDGSSWDCINGWRTDLDGVLDFGTV